MIYDITGFSEKIFRHAKIFENSGELFSKSIAEYCKEVRSGDFPTSKNCASVSLDYIKELREEL